MEKIRLYNICVSRLLPQICFLKYKIQFKKNKLIIQAVFFMVFGAGSAAKMFTTVRGRLILEQASFSWTHSRRRENYNIFLL